MTVQHSIEHAPCVPPGDIPGQDSASRAVALAPDPGIGFALPQEAHLGCSGCQALGYCRRETGEANEQAFPMPCC